jgi:uncharacterized protein YprB with RNaseH-like and TPR domain
LERERIPDERRRKLEEINGGALRTGAARTSAAGRQGGKGDRSLLPVGPEGCSAQKAPVPFSSTARLEDLIAGETAGTPEQPFFLIQRDLGELFARAEELTSEFRDVWVKGRHSLSDEETAHGWREIIESDPTRLLFLDIETLGLTATPVFLVGMMSLEADDDSRPRGEKGVRTLKPFGPKGAGHKRVLTPFSPRFRIRQLFARNYSEEPHLLAHLATTLREDHILVTYNGKTFDWPYLCDRAVYHSVSLAQGAGHMDLLKEARRRWRDVLPNCQLQTLEYHVSGRRRVGDLSGSMIPDAYHRYVKTGDARPMLDVIHHNALDLVTMAELMLFILQGGDLTWE